MRSARVIAAESAFAAFTTWLDLLAKEKATLWINHDKAQRDTLKLAPESYE